MLIAGLDLRPSLVLLLANLLRDADQHFSAAVLERAMESDQAVVPLTDADRAAIVAVLDEHPVGLDELRAALLTEQGGHPDG